MPDSIVKFKSQAAMISILIGLTLVVLKLVVGYNMGSVGVMSEATHSALDACAAVFAWIAVRESGKPADEKHHFGHGKVENLASLAEALLILFAGVYIAYEAIHKIFAGHFEVESLGLGAAVMAFSATANYFVAQNLFKVARETDSAALEGDAMHLLTDTYTSGGVLAGLILIKLTGLTILDPVIAILVACVIMKASYDLTRNALSQLLDASLPLEEESQILEILDNFTGPVVGYHKLRTRKCGSARHIDLHLKFPKAMTVHDSHELCHEVSAKIEDTFPYSHVLIHIEPCAQDCSGCGHTCSE